MNFVLGFDFGLKYIGLSIGESITNRARPLKTLLAKDGVPDWLLLDNLIILWNPCKLVVGVSSYVGDMKIIHFCTKKFIKKLKYKYKLPIYEIDEKYTTWEAKSILSNNCYCKNFIKINSISATIILEDWLNIK